MAQLAWRDSLVYRFNALMWVIYAVLPAMALMLVWVAAFEARHRQTRRVTLPLM